MSRGMWKRKEEELKREKGKWAQGREGEVLILCNAVSGEQGPSSPCSLLIKAHERSKAQCALCVVFHHFFQYVLIEPKPPCGTLTIPFTLLLSSLFSRLVIISQAPRVGSLSSFLRNDYLQTCYVKSYDIAHNTQDLSNRPPWKILVSTTQGPSGLMFAVYYYHKMRRKVASGTFTCKTLGKRKEEIWVVNPVYAFVENKYFSFWQICV